MALLPFFSNFAADLKPKEMLMRNFTLKLWIAGSLLLALLLGTQGVAAAEYPSIEELYGRYRFSGELTWTDMAGTSPEAPVPATDYDMIVLPGENENEVRKLVNIRKQWRIFKIEANAEQSTFSFMQHYTLVNPSEYEEDEFPGPSFTQKIIDTRSAVYIDVLCSCAFTIGAIMLYLQLAEYVSFIYS